MPVFYDMQLIKKILKYLLIQSTREKCFMLYTALDHIFTRNFCARVYIILGIFGVVS